MIDCVFLLLVFFLLTSAFRSPAVDLTLPSASHVEPPKEEEITVELNRLGQLHVNGRAVTLEELASAVRHAADGADDPPVTLRADAERTYQDVMGVVLAIREAGATRVRLAYEGESPP
jgi:biopolymer transport protein ExbD